MLLPQLQTEHFYKIFFCNLFIFSPDLSKLQLYDYYIIFHYLLNIMLFMNVMCSGCL
jgi:hypothetical protein